MLNLSAMEFIIECGTVRKGPNRKKSKEVMGLL